MSQQSKRVERPSSTDPAPAAKKQAVYTHGEHMGRWTVKLPRVDRNGNAVAAAPYKTSRWMSQKLLLALATTLDSERPIKWGGDALERALRESGTSSIYEWFLWYILNNYANSKETPFTARLPLCDADSGVLSLEWKVREQEGSGTTTALHKMEQPAGFRGNGGVKGEYRLRIIQEGQPTEKVCTAQHINDYIARYIARYTASNDSGSKLLAWVKQRRDAFLLARARSVMENPEAPLPCMTPQTFTAPGQSDTRFELTWNVTSRGKDERSRAQSDRAVAAFAKSHIATLEHERRAMSSESGDSTGEGIETETSYDIHAIVASFADADTATKVEAAVAILKLIP